MKKKREHKTNGYESVVQANLEDGRPEPEKKSGAFQPHNSKKEALGPNTKR